MVLPPRFEHPPGDKLVLHPLLTIEGQAPLGDQDVDMRVPLEIGAEGVEDGDDPGGKPLGTTPVKQRLPRGGEQVAQAGSVPPEEIPQFLGDGEYDVMIRHVQKPAH